MFNQKYRPKAKFTASNYKFPYEDNFFDFVILQSVFTHMVLDDMKNYLHEISRVLKKGGRSYISYFILNENSLNTSTYTVG